MFAIAVTAKLTLRVGGGGGGIAVLASEPDEYLPNAIHPNGHGQVELYIDMLTHVKDTFRFVLYSKKVTKYNFWCGT